MTNSLLFFIIKSMNIVINLKNGKRINAEAKEEQTILEVLWENGITEVPAPCGGRGRCGKCTVTVEGRGEVLACRENVSDGMNIYTFYPGDDEKNDLTTAEGSVIAEHGKAVSYPADGDAALTAACDIGTTTVVCHLIDGKTGEKLATKSEPNPQKSFGADVLSRVQAADAGNLKLLNEQITGLIKGMLSSMLGELKRRGETAGIKRLAVSANTIMSHLFAGISPASIGVAPFLPEEYFGRSFDGAALGLPVEEVYIAPAVSGFVGGDITADLLAVMGKDEKRETLLLDIGTNGEMAIGDGESFICCAAAAGSAFEGAQLKMGMPAASGAISRVYLDARRIRTEVIGENAKAKGICGSGLLDALAVLLEMGLVDERGMIKPAQSVSVAYRRYIGLCEGKSCIWLTPEVCLTQEDIRDLQLAKAAFAAGMQILIRERGITAEQIERVVICGGFGSYMDCKSAAAIGLIPPELLPVTESVGNSAGEGAVLAAVSSEARERLSEIKKRMHYIELSAHPEFAEEYMNHMSF
jgi:uncharacterized 2Fe-2S/4Fe-4S cluster protein (DUF4445 family)